MKRERGTHPIVFFLMAIATLIGTALAAPVLLPVIIGLGWLLSGLALPLLGAMMAWMIFQYIRRTLYFQGYL